MSARCIVCQYWIIDGKCVCNGAVGSVACEMTRWTRRGVLPLPLSAGISTTTCGCRCWPCVYGQHHLGQGLCRGG